MKYSAFPLLAVALMSSTALAQPQAGDLHLRARILNVAPSEDATVTGGVTGNTVSIDNSVVPELDLSYFVTDNIAIEAIAGATPHDVSAKTSSAGPLDLGSVWLLPPTVTVQYHFTDLGAFKPYVGAGVNYTLFFNEDAGASVTDVEYENSFGPALQAGVDYALDDKWSLNFDVKKIWINSDVKFNGGTIQADVDINPWIVGMGVGYTF